MASPRARRAPLSLTLLIAWAVAPPLAIADSTPPYLNPEWSAEVRVSDLMARMTLVEKIGQMCQFVGIEYIQKSEKNQSLAAMQANDAHGIYPNLHSSEIPDLIRRGEIGSFLHVKNPVEANRLQAWAGESRLKIPLLIGIDAIHGNGLVEGSTIYPTPLTMASSWNPALVRLGRGKCGPTALSGPSHRMSTSPEIRVGAASARPSERTPSSWPRWARP